MPEMKSLTLNDKTYDCFVDSVAREQVEATTVVSPASGSQISMTDASKYKFVEFSIYGKTTQEGTPTPTAPIDLVSVGDSGSITVSVTGDKDAQSMTIATPNGLPGIPVTADGNYTDANGQQWICDEINLTRGVHIRRISQYAITGNEIMAQGSAKWQKDGMYSLYFSGISPEGTYSLAVIGACLSTHAQPNEWEWMSYNRLNNVGMRGGIIYLSLQNDVLGIIDGDNDDTKLAKARNYVATQYANGTPVMVYYPLMKQVETPLSEEELAAYAALRTYRGNTAVSNDAGAWMELEYVMDAKKYIDGLTFGMMHQATVE